jgi:hypothetical protein
LQRFELGESGDGVSLLAKAGRAQDPTYVAALELFVIEEQKHSELFRRALEYLQYPTLASHWSDAAFIRLRRALGLRFELTLFLVAEVVALHYFAALRDGVPDRNLRAMAVRILADEEEHVHFQVQRLAEGFARTPGAGRAFVRATWWALATGAAIVVAVDHGKALRVCEVRRASFVRRALRSFRGVVTDVFNTDGPGTRRLLAHRSRTSRTPQPRHPWDRPPGRRAEIGGELPSSRNSVDPDPPGPVQLRELGNDLARDAEPEDGNSLTDVDVGIEDDV